MGFNKVILRKFLTWFFSQRCIVVLSRIIFRWRFFLPVLEQYIFRDCVWMVTVVRFDSFLWNIWWQIIIVAKLAGLQRDTSITFGWRNLTRQMCGCCRVWNGHTCLKSNVKKFAETFYACIRKLQISSAGDPFFR